MTARYIVGDSCDVLRSLPDGSVDLVLTSPPFLALRSYLPADHPAKHLEMGSEPTPGDFIDSLLGWTEECARVLAPHGSLVVELGDTYAGSGGGGGDYLPGGLREGQPGFGGSAEKQRDGNAAHWRQKNAWRSNDNVDRPGRVGRSTGWPHDKSLCLIPELYRVALVYGFNPLTGRQTEPWRARNVVRWHRPNPPVGALGDKFRPATSDMVVACKSRTRYFDLDAVREPHKTEHRKVTLGRVDSRDAARAEVGLSSAKGNGEQNAIGAPPLDTWTIPTEPYKGSHYACVDDQTEALTPNGWRRHDELADGDMIAAYDRASRTVKWEPAAFHRFPFDGELVAIDKRETSQRLTPNHRVLYRTRDGVENVARADEVLPSHAVPVAAPFDIGGTGPGPELAALLGWYIAEGTVGTRSVAIYQSETANPKHCARIRDLLDAVQAEYEERRRVRPAGASASPRESVEVRWAIHGSVAAWLLRTAPGKGLAAEVVFGWSDDECAALLDALVDGDGHTRPDGRRAFIQKDRATIDMVQALVCRLGLRSTLSERLDGQWSLTIGQRRWLSLRSTNGQHVALGREHYEGVVWCPSVASTFWLARRNGRPFITGNTWPTQLLTKPILAMCPQRVCLTCGEPSRRTTDAFTLDSYRRSDRPQTVKAVALADKHGLTDEHIAAIRAFGTSDAGKAIVVNDGAGRASDEVKRLAGEAKAVLGGYFREFVQTTTAERTSTWTDCGHDTWRPGVVLDPFAGSGTTLAVATGHGRDAIGIDLDSRNAELAYERVGMFLEVEYPETAA